jgi:Protein of unknown function (DUF559)
VNRARLLRTKATDTERILWRHLRNRNFAGYKFRRQHPLDRYILDFYCPTAKLAIELDGGGHNYRVGQVRDRTRSEFLSRKGIQCAAVLESSGSPGTRQRLASDLVCTTGAVFVETLTLILSLRQRERRAFGSVVAIGDSRRNRQAFQNQFNSAANSR